MTAIAVIDADLDGAYRTGPGGHGDADLDARLDDHAAAGQAAELDLRPCRKSLPNTDTVVPPESGPRSGETWVSVGFDTPACSSGRDQSRPRAAARKQCEESHARAQAESGPPIHAEQARRREVVRMRHPPYVRLR